MSMISSQIDTLRKAAQTCRELGKHKAEQMLLDAADTIWQLRDDLQRMNAENAKLREQVERLHADQAHWELGNCPSCPNVAALQEALEQNAKLRERVHELEMEGSDHFYRTAYAEDANRTLEAENAELRKLCSGLAQVIKNDDDTFRRLREIAEQELSYDFIGAYDSSLGKIDQITRFIDSMAELEIEVDW